MGNALGKTTGITLSTAAVKPNATEKIPRFYAREKITPPFRSGGGNPIPRTSAQNAVDAERRGLGGNFRQPVRELLIAMGRYR
jgi:hypothetical protein